MLNNEINDDAESVDLFAPGDLESLVAGCRSSDKEAQATAGIYMELIGNTTVADEYFEKAGPEMREKLDELFE